MTEEQLRARVAMLEEALRLPHVVTRSTQCWCEDSLRTTHDKTCREMRAALTSSDPSAWLAEREARAAAAEHDRIYKSLRNDGKLLTPEREAQVRREALNELRSIDLIVFDTLSNVQKLSWQEIQANLRRAQDVITKMLAATPSEPTPKPCDLCQKMLAGRAAFRSPCPDCGREPR